MLTIADQSSIDPDWAAVMWPVVIFCLVVWAMWLLALWWAEREVHRAHVETGVRASDSWCRYCDRELTR